MAPATQVVGQHPLATTGSGTDSGSGDVEAVPLNDYALPYPVQFQGSPFALWLSRRMGWSWDFAGLPTRRGIFVVYPHTSNWDFPNIMVAKWAIGLAACFWAKDSLFRVPLFGRWLRWLGGIPVQRVSAAGAVDQMVTHFRDAAARDDYLWLALAPEGTRKRIQGLRSGFYRLAVQAKVPVCLVAADYRRRHLRIVNFLNMTGDEVYDMGRMARVFADVQGRYPENASPVRLLDSSIPRSETIVR